MRPLLALFFSVCALSAGDLSDRRAPSFSLPDQKQVQHDIQDYRGKLLLIEWMQTGCAHCAKFSTILEDVKAKYKGKLDVVSIVLPPDTLEMVNKYIATNKTTIPVLFDSGQMTATYLKITPANPTVVFPQLFIVDGTGTIKENYKFSNDTIPIFEGKALYPVLEKLVK